MPDTILISELYGPVLQGEGALVGRVSHFVRTAGCGYRCNWCDSMHAVDPWQIKEKARAMTAQEIVAAVRALPPAAWVTLTGGDPVAWDLTEVCTELDVDYNLAVETQGAMWHDWLEQIGIVTCSPKPPSSGMDHRFDPLVLSEYVDRLGDKLVLKIVAFDEVDLDWIEWVHDHFHEVPLYITAGTPTREPEIPGVIRQQENIQDRVLKGYRTIAEQVLKRPRLMEATVLCQQHVLLYGRALGV